MPVRLGRRQVLRTGRITHALGRSWVTRGRFHLPVGFFLGIFHTLLRGTSMETKPRLTPGRVYRTRELRKWSANPTRLAKRLVSEGLLEPLSQGLFVHPREGRFGAVPPSDDEVMRAFLEGSPFVFTGSEQWNALGLGATAVFPTKLVYNTKRSGEFTLGGRRFLLRRVGFPRHTTPEWFVVDLLEHHEVAGVSLETLERELVRALAARRFDARELLEVARAFGSRRTQSLVERAGEQAGAAA